MSEYNNNDPLEELFQRKAEEYNISYREEDWNDLDKRLDGLDAKYAARKRRWLAAAVVLIAFSVLGYFTFQNYQQINSLNDQLSQTEETTISPSERENEEAENIEPEQTNPPESNNEKMAASSSGDNNIQEQTPASDNDVQEPAPNETKEEFTTVNNTGQLAVEQIDCRHCDLSSLITLNPVDRALIQPTGQQNAPTKWAATSFQKAAGAVPSQSLNAQRTIPKTTVGFVMGPDLSTVGSISNFSEPGYKLGVNMEYNLNANWGISIGAIYTNMHYKAGNNGYNLPQGYWGNGIQASETIGQCILIDIPVSLNYRLLHFNHSRIYASAGFSSYIMLNEDYRFRYNSYQAGQPQRWNEDTGTTHFLNNANFSVGYELDIGQNLSLRAEPFLKVPLKEVGWTNASLYSVGSIFSFNYHFQ